MKALGRLKVPNLNFDSKLKSIYLSERIIKKMGKKTDTLAKNNIQTPGTSSSKKTKRRKKGKKSKKKSSKAYCRIFFFREICLFLCIEKFIEYLG